MDSERQRSRQKSASKGDIVSKYHFPETGDVIRNRSLPKQMRRRQSSDDSDTRDSELRQNEFAQKRMPKFDHKREKDSKHSEQQQFQRMQGRQLLNYILYIVLSFVVKPSLSEEW